ncbi:MAG: DUF1800 domain-containing protein [Proteobacteria bacterium]|nr:DUF1800 domain-containing protein [Pseudomonadota bacterium]
MQHAFTAATRFGLGPRPGELRAIGGDPRGWLKAQLGDLSGPRGRTIEDLSGELRPLFKQDDRKAFKARSRELLEAEERAAAEHARTTRAPFNERLVRFFSNHFTVSVARREVAGLVGSFEREAIREGLTGSFGDLLVAVVRHPAMLTYLDNVRSVGPGSIQGQRTGRDINENLGREILELHTLGVDGGYGQSDVEALAHALTGWTVDEGGFVFLDRMHEGEPQTVLGTTYHATGVSQALQVLRDLATHPSTAQHVCTKLARHFVQDDPPEAAVRALEDAWWRTDGHLPAVFEALVELEAAWDTPLAKLRTPQELVLAAARALDVEDADRMVRSYRLLGQSPWSAPSPQGWSDRAADWAGPDAVVARVDWARRVGAQIDDIDVDALVTELAGPFASKLLRRQADDPEGLALLLASPTFNRR